MTDTPITNPPGRLRRAASGLGGKVAMIAFLVLVTMIPAGMISNLIDEREQRQGDVAAEFNSSWGPEQEVRTPILVVPFEPAPGDSRRYLKIAPSRLSAAAELAPERRKRGLFHATLFESRIALRGRFDLPSAAQLTEALGGRGERLHWEQAFIMAATSGLGGMRPRDHVTWDGTELAWQNCREVIGRAEDCDGAAVMVARPALAGAPSGPVEFQASLTVRGTGALRLRFIGRELEASLAAPWPTPSFTGTLLPTSSSVGADGFSAQWQAVDYSAPRLWRANCLVETDAKATSLGVDLLEATPTYRMVHRAAAYDLLFVVLAFTAYFLFELLSGMRIHPIQYGLLGLSLSLFPLLLLSFSEPLGYTPGYALAALPVLVQASLYTATVVRRPLQAGLFAALLAGLFGFLYVVLSLESYALLVGSVALFVVLSGVMALTQRVDWSGSGSSASGS